MLLAPPCGCSPPQVEVLCFKVHPHKPRLQTCVLLIGYTCYVLSMSYLVLWPFGLREFHTYSCCQTAIPHLPSLLVTCFRLMYKVIMDQPSPICPVCWLHVLGILVTLKGQGHSIKYKIIMDQFADIHRQGVWDGHRLIRFLPLCCHF